MSCNGVSFEPKKIKQGMSYSKKEKTIIMNVFKYFRSQCTDKTVTEIVRCTAKATGCSEKSIFCFRKEEVSPQGFKEPSKKKIRRNVNTNNRLVKYNEGIREAIKNIIYDLKSKNILPTLSVILKNISSNNLPSFSIMTLRRLLCDMGFYYEKDGNKSILVEKASIKKELTDLNKSLVIEKPVEPTKINSKESLGLVSNHVPSTIPNEFSESKNYQSDTGHTPYIVGGEIIVKKSDEKLQTYPGIKILQTPRIQALGSYQENHFAGLGPPPSSHMPMMFPPRMPPYHLHSSVPHSYPPDMELHLKRQETSIPHYSQLPPHNAVMH